MSGDVDRLVSDIEGFGLEELRELWRRRYGPPPPLRSVPPLRLLLAWRVQAEEHGGLDPDTKRTLARKGPVRAEGLDLGIGACLTREWQGRTYKVEVTADGFRCDDRAYRSLSAVATAIAGSRWNGPRFFGAARRGLTKSLATGSIKPPAKRCAIYTRKSSDEGLDQAFNSLDAQREAGEAYVTSQASEGWKLIATRYDDGGFSGGSMERPALHRLLGDVEAGRVDVVVVYKIDRLTRSLADFARIVERFDARGVSFVSVTQAFNTTSSMGRLTLNVLLSFAQFEREVTGERIRDKIAASKARGMWMGGVPPLGYDIPVPGSRCLRINEGEAATVRAIFGRYLETGSVHRLVQLLDHDGVTSKRHVTSTGRVMGGVTFGRGALFHLLRNRTYLGEIVHKEQIHPGEHEAIVPRDLFEQVQARLSQKHGHARRGATSVAGASLVGKVHDASGELMSPAHSRGRSGSIYRYYVSTSLQRGGPRKAILQRVPAPALEATVSAAFERLIASNQRGSLKAVHVHREELQLILSGTSPRLIGGAIADGEIVEQHGRDCVVTIPLALVLRGGARSVTHGRRDGADPDQTLIAALRKARALLANDVRGLPLIGSSPVSPYERRLLRLGLLAPDIQQAILAGRQPRSLNLERLIRGDVPLGWAAQRQAFGFSEAR